MSWGAALLGWLQVTVAACAALVLLALLHGLWCGFWRAQRRRCDAGDGQVDRRPYAPPALPAAIARWVAEAAAQGSLFEAP